MDEKYDESLAFNFSYLFEGSVLKKLIQTRNLKPKQFYARFEEDFLCYLRNDSPSYETTINLNDFFDIIKHKCEYVQYHLQVIQAFEALDYDCQGRARAIYLEDHLLKCGTVKLANFLEKNLNSFSYSTVIPGPIDVFDDSQNYPLDKIVEFSYRNRCEFKNLLPKFSRKLIEKFELRTNILEVLLQEFYCRGFKKTCKTNILDETETPMELQTSDPERAENYSNDLASVLYIWLLKFIGSISSALIAVNPGLAEEALNHIRWALSHLDFFQLSGNHTLTSNKCSSSGPFLKGVVDEMRSLSHQLTKVTDAQEVHLWVEFICGDVFKILCIILSDPLPVASPLIKKLKSARNQIFQKESFLLEEINIESDGVLLSSLPDKICRYASQFNSTCLHILSQVNDQLAIKDLKIVVGQEIPQVIKVYVCKSDNFKIEDLSRNLPSFNEEDLGLQLLATLTASNFQKELNFSFDQPIFGKKILVKFISNRGQLSNVGVGFYGLSLPLPLVEFTNKMEEQSTNDLQMESLLFLSCAAACKSQKARRKRMNKFNFSTFSNAFLDEDTGVLISKSSEMAKVVAVEPLSKEYPSFEIEVRDGENLDIYVGLVGKGFNDCSQLPGFEPWSLAFHGESGGIHEGNLDAKSFKPTIKPKEKLIWRIEFNSEKSTIIFERNGEINFEKEIPESISLYPALALRKGATVVLLNKEPWRPKQDGLDELSWLSIDNLPFEIFLKLLKKYENNNSMIICTLHVLHNMLPFIPMSTPRKVVKDLLAFVCDLVDSQNDADVIKIFQKLLSRGMRLFFSEEEYELFDLSKEVSTKRSSVLVFEALCQHIGECEPQRLLSLPDQINDSEKHRIISSMQHIISFLTYKPCSGDSVLPNPSFIHLLSSLQTLLFSWCFEQMSKPENEEDVCGLISSYITLIMNSTLEEIHVLNSLGDSDLESTLKRNTLLSMCFRQLLVLIGQSCDWSSQTLKKNILEAMQVIYSPLKRLILKLCDEKWGIFCETLTTIHWFYDVTTSFFHLMGRLCGSSIQVIPGNSELTKIIEGKGIDGLLSSEIWRLIFRAGLQTSSKQEIQRSLSGKHGAVVESEALGFLLSLNEGENDLAQDFIKRCQVLSNKTNLAGGTHVNSAVIALFSALVWHTQPIRESLESYIASDFKDEISEGILHAYKAAEILRMPMMKKRQVLIEEKMDRDVERIDREELNGKLREEDVDAEKGEGHKEEMDKGEGVSNEEGIEVCENCPIADMKLKSEFLLKFAGLQRMQEAENKLLTNMGTSMDTAQNLKQSDFLAMYPSFQLVLNFVKDPHWTQTQVESLLDSRKRQAIMLAKGFRHAAEFLVAFEFENISSRIQTIGMPVFFAGLLEGQSSFSKHHLDSLDGCGLMMESKVRQEFYRFFKMLTSTSSQLVCNANGDLSNGKDNAYYNCIIAATLHFLDVNWQIEDFKTLLESGVVDFILSVISGLTIEGFRPVEVESTEDWCFEEELKTYSEHMHWIKEIDVIGVHNFKYPRNAFASRRTELDKLLFVSRYQLRYEQEYRCDFCREALKITENEEKEGYYRCTECNDFDICVKCAGKQIRQGNHMPYHKMVLLKHVCKGCRGAILNVRYKCDQCPKIQWCTGCVFMKKFNHEEHISDHILIMERLPPVSCRKSAKSCLASYNQRHAALQLSNIALRSFGCLAKKSSGKDESRKSVGDFDYQSSAEQLYEMCIKGTMKMLLERNSRGPSKAWKADVEGEKVFSIDDILFGLLARLLPPDDTFMHLKKVWRNGRVITSLLEILTCYEDEEIIDCKLLALALLKRIVQMEDSISCEDISFFMDTLMVFGSHCLHRGQLEYCGMVVDAVRAPSNDFWRNFLISIVGEKIMNFNEEPDRLILVFYALVLVGFPKLPSFGYPLCYFNDEERKLKKGILLRSCVNNFYEIIDVETRRKEQAEQIDVTYASYESGIPLKLSFSLLGIMESIFQKQEDNTEDSELLGLFLSILIKAQSTLRLDDGLQSSINVVLPRIVHSFLNGNKLSRMLASLDVENLVASLATLKGSKPSSEDESLIGADPLADIEDLDLKLQFETLSQDNNILNPYICRAIYNLYKDDRAALADELMNTVMRAILSDEVKESLKDVELTYKSKCSKGEEVQLEEDLDISFDLFGLSVKQEVELLRKSGMVMEEGNIKPVKLMSSKLLKEENQRKQGIETMKKNESLIKIALEKARMDEGYKKALFKKAKDTLMSINCKQFLTFFLLNTNFEEVLKINLMQDLKQLSSPSNDELWCSLVISLLAKGRDEDLMRRLLRNVLSTSTPSTLELFINVAHNFMLDLTVIQHMDLKNEQGFVEVNGAESLVIQFPESLDSKEETSSSSEFKPHLLISSSSTFDPLMHSLPISGSMSIEIQGNKFHHKIDGGSIDGKFLVMRKVRSKELQSAGLEVFQHVIYDQILLRKVNVGNLWVRLLRLFYELTSTKRIKILSLILRISTSEYSETLDFSLLNHAWSYYRKLVTSNIEPNSKVIISEDVSKPAIFLGLTELFASLATNTSVSRMMSICPSG